MRPAALAALLLCLVSAPCSASTLVVAQAGGGDYETLTAALEAAASHSDVDRLYVRRGTYTESVTVAAGLTLEGEDTAGTTLSGTVALADGVTLERFTVTGAVSLTNVATATVRNNIFADTTGSALRLDPDTVDDAAVHVVSNTFYNNQKGVEFLSASSAELRHNLFVTNRTAISRATATWGSIKNNQFYRNDQNVYQGSLGTDNVLADPLFVGENSTPRDLHVTLGSSACGLGAYGDTDAEAFPDSTPAAPTGLAVSSEGTNLLLTWDGNASCDSTVGRYRVNAKASGSSAYVVLDEVDASGTGDQHDTVVSTNPLLGDLPDPPAVPSGLTAAPLDGALRLSWTTTTGADGYQVTWGTAADALGQPEDTTDVSHLVRGLTNGETYFVAVASYADRTHLYTVTGLPVTPPADESEGESLPSAAKTGATGKAYSDPSAAVSAVPDNISGTPALEGNAGCFVGSLGGTSRGGELVTLAGVFALAGLCRRRRGAAACVAVAAALVATPQGAHAEGPRWAVTAAGGVFYPREDNWGDHYDSNHLGEGKVGVGFRLLRQLEVGVDGGYRRAKGEIAHTDNGTALNPPVKQTLTVYPLQAYALVQFCFAENQWVVPYVAGGYSRYYYRHEIDYGDTTKGHLDGYHVRGGLKLLLDVLDDYFAQRAAQNWGLLNTYLNLEAQYAKVDNRGAADANLGGMSYSAGFVVEF